MISCLLCDLPTHAEPGVSSRNSAYCSVEVLSWLLLLTSIAPNLGNDSRKSLFRSLELSMQSSFSRSPPHKHKPPCSSQTPISVSSTGWGCWALTLVSSSLHCSLEPACRRVSWATSKLGNHRVHCLCFSLLRDHSPGLPVLQCLLF